MISSKLHTPINPQNIIVYVVYVVRTCLDYNYNKYINISKYNKYNDISIYLFELLSRYNSAGCSKYFLQRKDTGEFIRKP